MRVLIIHNNHQILGGNDAAALHQLQLMQDAGMAVEFFSAAQVDPEVDLRKSASVTTYFYNHKAANLLKQTIRNFKPDVLHVHGFAGKLSNSILKVIKDAAIPSVFTVHDYRLICPAWALFANGSVCTRCPDRNALWPVLAHRCNKNSIVNSAVNWLDATIAHQVFDLWNTFSHFHFVSRFIYDIHLKYHPSLAANHFVFPNFSFDIPFIQPEPPAEIQILLYLGRLSEEKGILEFVKAFMAQPGKAHLIVAGSGPLEDELRTITASSPQVHLEGWVSGSQKADLLAKAHWLVLPSKWYENNPISLIEAMVAGKPILASNRGGIPEMVQDGQEGFLFDPYHAEEVKQKLQAAFNTTGAAYLAMSAAGRQKYLTAYKPAVFMENLTKMYKQMIEAASKKSNAS